MRTKRSAEIEAIDRHLGHLVRVRRKALKLSQSQLAERIGVTYQQVQKYESGDTRLAAAQLVQIAEELGTPIAFFFSALEGEPAPEGGDFLQLVGRMSAAQRHSLHDFVASLAAPGAAPESGGPIPA